MSGPLQLSQLRVVTDPAGAAVTARALGVDVRLSVTAAGGLDRGARILDADLEALDLAASRFRADSEVVALDAAGGAPVRISPLLAQLVAAALRAAELTDGDVDPTLGTNLAAVGYDRDFSQVPARGPAVAVRIQPVAGWRAVQLDRARRVLRLPPGVRLDLGATAKAWAADRIAARLATRLGCGVLLCLGGDVAAAGPAPHGGWRVRIDEAPDWALPGPEEASGASVAGRADTTYVRMPSGGLATSSTSARRWVRGGTVMHHILDPRTGMPATEVWRTVTVAAGSCLDANIASTAAIVRGARAPMWLARLRLPARMIGRDGRIATVAGWPAEAEAA